MDAHDAPRHPSRKTVLRAAFAAGLAAPAALMGVPALAGTAAADGAPKAPPQLTPACDDGDDPTPPQMEGPYFKPGSPRRSSLLEPGGQGVRLEVRGQVLGLGCRGVGAVLLDFWQADANGAYDNVTYRYRGHQFTDAGGAFRLTTIVPGLYPGRTRHLHVKVQAPGRPVLTTQLYFPGEPRNATDALFDPRLLMAVRDADGVRYAAFDFVLDVPQAPGGTWAVGTEYRAGDRVTYGGRGHVCLQGHTSQQGWEPPNVPALWRAG
ncbi:dioxygenase [Streptomyces sp. MUM 203J]|uniref:carbohydrate-binding protein n=1 Tax=Streptomyces sp. MUM 203J TaxID=2791990 RepID=UPI001F0501E1|nr:carbohydrate-binding protein [Streptomyces sp. MUM 203J]MCH0541834.1 dioxygenase [Streptomyces sp. MUM 203J]